MEIKVAKTAGFCFGVKRAVDMAFSNVEKENTYTYGPIIHNEFVTNALKEKGVHALDDLENQDIKTLIIRSHGVSPDVYKWGEEKQVEMIDATCPYVKKIHRLVAKYSDKGYHIIIAGNAQHPEIKGIKGWAKSKCYIVKDVNELKEIHLPEDKQYLLVAQTTYKKELVDQIETYLKEVGISFESVHTICNATRERQDEVKQLAAEVECMLVLGSPNSANTKKLFEISQEYCKASYCIQSEEELTKEMLEGHQKVGITAGASTPQIIIDRVIEKINQLEN